MVGSQNGQSYNEKEIFRSPGTTWKKGGRGRRRQERGPRGEGGHVNEYYFECGTF